MNRGAMGFAAMFAHHVSDSGDDSLAIGLCEKVDFHLDALADLVGLFQLQQGSGHTQIQDLPCVPFRLCYRAYARRPSHVMSTGAPRLDLSHRSRAQQDPRAALG